MIKGWKDRSLSSDRELSKWMVGKGSRFSVYLVYQDESGFAGLEHYVLPREEVRVMCNDPSVRERAASTAAADQQNDVQCFVALPPIEFEDFKKVRRETGLPEQSVLDAWVVSDGSSIEIS